MSESVSPIRVYADTSVYGGVFDREFARPSQRFFDEVRQGRFELVISSIIDEEVSLAAENVLALFYEFFDSALIIELSSDAVSLRNAYLSAGIVTAEAADHAAHVAMATIAGCSLFTSWDFKHIVHYSMIPKYNAINVLHGMPPIAIHPPSAVICYDE